MFRNTKYYFRLHIRKKVKQKPILQQNVTHVISNSMNLMEHGQTLESIGTKDVPVRKMKNLKAAHSLIIFTK